MRKREAFGTGVTLDYRPQFTTQEYALLTAGRVSTDMDEKWDVTYDAPFLDFHRSWTGKPVYRMTLVAGPNGGSATETLWTGLGVPDPSYNGQLLDFLVQRLLLRREATFPVPPDSTVPEAVARHSLVGVLPELADGESDGSSVPD